MPLQYKKLMRKKIVAGNWKMNTTLTEAKNLTSELKQLFSNDIQCEMVVCPPFTWLTTVSENLNNSPIKIGSQNISHQEKGAFTGETSVAMIKEAGATYAIIGHSERRSLYGETNEVIHQKLIAGLSHQLNVILCCGETLEERNAGKLEEILTAQIQLGIGEMSLEYLPQLVIAYEPVWAIGTGLTASPEQAQEAHHFIRKLLSGIFGETAANNISILYGGSCNASNASVLFSQADIDGGLIGGASLKAQDFITIAKSF